MFLGVRQVHDADAIVAPSQKTSKLSPGGQMTHNGIGKSYVITDQLITNTDIVTVYASGNPPRTKRNKSSLADYMG